MILPIQQIGKEKMIPRDHNKIYIYSGNPQCLEGTAKAIESTGVALESIAYLKTFNEVSSIKNIKETTLVIPGGSTLQVLTDLQKESCKVKQYVQEGGSVLGICAGSIVLTREFIKEGIHPRIATTTLNSLDGDYRTLDLASVNSKWPVFRNKESMAIQNRIVTPVHFASTGQTANMAFQAGPKFQKPEEWDGEVVATYSDVSGSDNIAAWHSNFDDGKVVGIGFHPELPLEDQSEQTKEGIDFLSEELKWARSCS